RHAKMDIGNIVALMLIFMRLCEVIFGKV
ncbi:MAG: hypothetical protein K0S90_2411, partial [Enterobacteriaceae bacterium]|nr:hypothetical protein [Enterobacteriaceae bacterium]